MEIGAVFPHLEIGSDPIVIRDWAQAVEEIGYSHILVYDHVIGAVHEEREPPLWGPYTEESLFHEIFVLFGYFAASTQHVGLASGVVILPQRQTVLVAKQAAEVDLLSGGRLRLGVGTGWNYVEYESLNESFDNRGRRQEEQIEVLRALWREPVLSFEGRWHHIDRAGIKPLPGRQIPIWFGGFSDVAFRRAARIGDGFIFGSGHDQNLEARQRLKVFLDAERRDETFGIEALVNYQAGKGRWVRDVQDWMDVGANYVSMRAMALRGMGDGLGTPQAHIDALSTYWKEVGDLSTKD